MSWWSRRGTFLVERVLESKAFLVLSCIVENVLGFALFVAAIALAVLIALQLNGCSSSPPAPLTPCREMPRGYCAYTDPR